MIYDLLNEQKKKNVAVMYIGEDLDVLLELSDRIMVLCHGKITGILDARTATKEQIGMLMTGDTDESAQDSEEKKAEDKNKASVGMKQENEKGGDANE